MGHVDALDHDSLTRELLAGAHAWQIGDWASAVNRLRAGFEVLTQARERFYPVDAYLIDLCLLDPAMPAGVLADPLENPVAISFIAPGAGDRKPGVARSAAAWRRCGRRSATAGPTWWGARIPRPKTRSCRWSRSCGSSGGATRFIAPTSTTATSRPTRAGGLAFTRSSRRSPSGLDFGSRFTWVLTRAGSRSVPRPSGSGRAPTAAIWRALLRPPMAADRPSQGWLFPWRMAATMKNDHVAALPLVHWPKPVAPWYLDLRRAAGLFAGAGAMDDPQRLFPSDRPALRDVSPGARYVPIALPGAGGGPARARADRAAWPATIGCGRGWRRRGRSRRWRGRSRRPRPEPRPRPDAAGDLPALEEIENLIETGRHDEAATALARVEPVWSAALARGIVGTSADRGRIGERRPPGYLVINPLNVPRRAAVILPDAALDLRPDGPLRAAQFTDEGVWAVVDLPAFGFAWVPKEADLGRPPASSAALSARAASSATSRSRSRSTRPRAAFAAWPAWASRRPGSGSNLS